MSTSKIKTAELTGAALDWAVGKAVGAELRIMKNYDGTALANHPLTLMKVKKSPVYDGVEIDHWWSPSTDWSQGGPLIEKYHITFSSIWNGSHSRLFATIGFRRTISGENANGTGGKEFNYLLAACRAIVAAKLGDEVEVPQELVG